MNVARMEKVEVSQEGKGHGAGAERAIDGNSNTRWDLKGRTFYDQRVILEKSNALEICVKNNF